MKAKYLTASLLAIFLITACSSEPSNIAACTYAQIEIESKLKSPSSAEFPACAYQSIEETSPKNYKVESYVDAENSFGANIRTRYSCTVRFTDGSEYYVNCSFDS